MRTARIQRDELAQKIRDLKAAGLSHKVIADRLGYSYNYIRELAVKMGLTRKKGVAAPTTSTLNNCGDMRPEET